MRKFIIGLALVIGAAVASHGAGAAPLPSTSVAVAAAHVRTAQDVRPEQVRYHRGHLRHARHNRLYR